MPTFDWEALNQPQEAIVNRPAIHDLLGSVLCGWYESVAEWRPPGRLGATTCVTCRSSMLASKFDVAQWPHDLMHQLAIDLDTAAVAINESLAEERGRGRRAARDSPSVADEFSLHLGDIADVLAECVAPRLDEWISAEVSRSFLL